jgi:hypothetical protein
LVLCGLLADFAEEERLLSDVLKETKIRYVRGFSLKFRMNKGITPEEDPDREYVNQSKEVATQALRIGTDHLLLFDLMGQDNTEQDRIRVRNILRKAAGESGTVLESARGLHLPEVHFKFISMIIGKGKSSI